MAGKKQFVAALSLVKLLISLTSGTFPQITIISLSGHTYEGFLILDDLPKTKDVNGVAIWPKNVINYTTKTQFLFRINKGVLDLSDDKSLNRYTPEENRPIPFKNMIYIGDGLTDVPCMKLVKVNGGCSIAVYPGRKKKNVTDLLSEGRVNYIELADYSEHKKLFRLVSDIIEKMAIDAKLRNLSSRQINSLKRNKDSKSQDQAK